jgi:hypothetical protein
MSIAHSPTSTVVSDDDNMESAHAGTEKARNVQTGDVERTVRDVEKGRTVEPGGGKAVKSDPGSSQSQEDPWTVKWDGEDDMGSPLNLAGWRKW